MALNNIQGGGINVAQVASCDCRRNGQTLPRFVQDHHSKPSSQVMNVFSPATNNTQRCACVTEQNEAANQTLTAPYDIYLDYVPPKHLIHSVFYEILADASTAGLVFDVVALTTNPDTGVVGAVQTGIVPAGATSPFLGVTGAATKNAGAGVASGGYYTGDNGVTMAIRVTTLPTGNSICDLKSKIALIANVEHFQYV